MGYECYFWFGWVAAFCFIVEGSDFTSLPLTEGVCATAR